jgi:glycosyltransferase involved in cell wall biosynthesis
MKIAQISATFPPYMAGTGIVCYHSSLELSKLGHEVSVFTATQSENQDLSVCGLNVVRTKPLFSVGNAAFTPQLLKINEFDIVHLHYPYYFGGELVCLLNLLKSQKYVVTYHNDVVGTGFLKYLFDIHSKTLMNVVLRNASRICAHTMDYAKNSKLNSFLNIESKIVEIPNGVDPSLFNPSVNGDTVRNKYQLHGKKIILFVRALDSAHHHSGLEYLLNSVASIDDKDVVLMIVGEGNLKQHYMEMSKQMKIEDKVLFIGRVENRLLPSYYAASDIVVLPSTLTENFPLIIIEAMASGKAVVCSNLPGVRSIVDNNVNGLLVNPRDSIDLKYKIETLLENKEMRDMYGKNGRWKVENKYSWEKIGLQLEKLYQDVLI